MPNVPVIFCVFQIPLTSGSNFPIMQVSKLSILLANKFLLSAETGKRTGKWFSDGDF